MAYSDYGAFIWKNGENITDKCADIACKLKNGFFGFDDWFDNLGEYLGTESREYKIISGHAVINLGKFCIVFYKTFNPKIYYTDGTSKELNILEKDYKNKKENLYISGYNLGYETEFFFYEINYKEDKYCVIVGSGIGKGFENTPASKYVLKHLVLFERCDGQIFYRIDTKHDVDWDIVFNKLDRLEDINREKYWLRRYRKDFLKCLFKFKFKDAIWNLNEALEHKEKIKWLK